MLHISRRTNVLTLIAIGTLILAAGMQFVHFGGPGTSGIPTACSSGTLYAGLFIAWAVSIDYRIVQKDIRAYLIASACMMVFWIVAREIKYSFVFELDMVSRYLWYSYYIPMIFLPALLFMTALRIGQKGQKPFYGRWKLLFIPAVIMVMGVFTNDWHQMAFHFRPGFDNWGTEYTYGILYKIIVAWIITLIVASLALVFYKCRISKIKRSIWVPIVFLVVCTFYLLWTYTESFIYGQKVFQVPEMFCFMIVALCESCIQVGLIPSNIGYGDFFNASTVCAQLADETGKICYASENAVALTVEQINAAEHSAVFLDKNTRLRSYPVSGGKVLWTDDLSAINRMNNEISEIKEQLSKHHDLLRAETELKERTVRAAEQNRLYDVITAVVKPQLNQLAILLGNTAPNDAKLREKFALACVLNAYIKRRSNLALIGHDCEQMQSFELVSSIRESVEYLNVDGIPCSFDWKGEGLLPTEALILAYELFEMVVEASLPKLSGLLVNLAVMEGALVLKLSMEDEDTKIDANWEAKRVKACGGMLRVKKEDGTVFVTFDTREGSVMR